MAFPIDTYPTAGGTNNELLFTTLGEFWTQVFNDRPALRGLARADAEETWQAYYSLVDAIHASSASDIQIFRKIKWLPTPRRSSFPKT
jgi:hypothetical protein